MSPSEFKSLQIGDLVKFSSLSRNHGKVGVVVLMQEDYSAIYIRTTEPVIASDGKECMGCRIDLTRASLINVKQTLQEEILKHNPGKSFEKHDTVLFLK